MSYCTGRVVVRLVLPAMLLCAGPPAAALNIAPVMVELSPGKKVMSIRVLNDSNEAMTFQAETLSWQQVTGVDRYAQTQDLLVAPAIFQIAPGASQILRVTLRKPPVTDVELAYRLILEDVTEESSLQPGTVKLRFRHNLPLFAAPHQPPLVNSQWRRCAAPANKACIELNNQGNRRVRLTGVAVEGPNWRKDIRGGATVLAGSSRQWFFDLEPGQSAALRVIPTSDIGDILKAVTLPGPKS